MQRKRARIFGLPILLAFLIGLATPLFLAACAPIAAVGPVIGFIAAYGPPAVTIADKAITAISEAKGEEGLENQAQVLAGFWCDVRADPETAALVHAARDELKRRGVAENLVARAQKIVDKKCKVPEG